MLQNPQILPRGDLGSVFVPQPIVGHPEPAVGEQVLAIPIVLESARLPHQLVDNVPVVDGVLVASHQPRQRVDLLAGVPDFHAVGGQPRFECLAYQPAVHRIHIAMNVDQTPRVHPRGQPQTTLQTLRRKRSQDGEFFRVPIMPRCVARGDHLLQKRRVLVAAAEVPAAPQEQRLIHGVLEVAMRRLGIAVLVRLPDIDPLAGQAVMFQQAAIPCLELAFDRQVVDRRGQAVAAMPSRSAPQFP